MNHKQDNGGVQGQGPSVPQVSEGGDERDGAQRPITAEARGTKQQPCIDSIDIAKTHHPKRERLNDALG